MKIEPILLTGNFIRLEPLSLDHVPDLTVAAQDESIWRYMRYGMLRSEEQMQAWVSFLLDRQASGTELPFAVHHLKDEKVIGATRYLDIQPWNRSVEIGGTWYAIAYQRSAVNTEAKYLLLRHAFESLGCVRVQLKTDVRNLRSQKAIERLGAVREGVLRNHMILPDGSLRSSIIYSILASEWPGVKAHLEGLLAK